MVVTVCARAVYAEVETRISALRNLLLDKLLEMPSTLHDQKRYIRWVDNVQIILLFIIAQLKRLLLFVRFTGTCQTCMLQVTQHGSVSWPNTSGYYS